VDVVGGHFIHAVFHRGEALRRRVSAGVHLVRIAPSAFLAG
jgi:hypothetical protein